MQKICIGIFFLFYLFEPCIQQYSYNNDINNESNIPNKIMNNTNVIIESFPNNGQKKMKKYTLKSHIQTNILCKKSVLEYFLLSFYLHQAFSNIAMIIVQNTLRHFLLQWRHVLTLVMKIMNQVSYTNL